MRGRDIEREGERDGEGKRRRERAREGEIQRGRGATEEVKEGGREEGWRGILMSFKELQIVILAELAREEMTEGRYSGWVGVCPRISETRSRDTDI